MIPGKNRILQRIDLLRLRIVLRHCHMGRLGLHGGMDPGHTGQRLLSPPRQLIHHRLIEFRAEQTPENQLPLIRLRPQQRHKLALSDHRHLHELAFRQADDLHQLLIGLLRAPRKNRSVRQRKRHRLLLLPKAGSLLQRTEMAGRPPDLIDPNPAVPLLGESQLGKRLRADRRVLTLQLRAVLPVALRACLTVKCEHDRVENCGLSGARIAGDQKKVLRRRCKIHRRPLSVRTESLHDKFNRPHRTVPPS